MRPSRQLQSAMYKEISLKMVQYCAKVMQANFDKILGFWGAFDEILLTAKYQR